MSNELTAKTNEKITLGEKIALLRIRKGWSQTRLADEAGLSQQVISMLEAGHKTARIDTIARVFRALGYRVEIVATPVEEEASHE